MKDYHSILSRQLKREFGRLEDVPEEWGNLLAQVDDAYREFDLDREMLERSLDLSSAELLQANSEMRAVFRAIPDLFVWLATDGTILDAQGGDRDTYPRPEKLKGSPLRELVGSGSDEELGAAIEEVIEKGTVATVEYSVGAGDVLAYFEARIGPLIPGQMIAVIRDITTRVRAENELAAEKERLVVTLQSIGDGVIASDISGRIVLLNRIAAHLTGWTPREAAGRPLHEVFQTFDQLSKQPQSNLVEDVLEADGAHSFEGSCLLRTKNGVEHLIARRAAPIRDRDSRIIGIVVAFRDVGEEVRKEAERLRATKLESLATLAGGIAHDFNNILTSVLGNITLTKMAAPDNSEVHDFMSHAQTAAGRARDLTQQLSTFSRGGAPVKQTASIGSLIEESARFALRGSNVSCRLAISEQLPALEVDRDQISHVISNLVINASEAMPEGGQVSVDAETVNLDRALAAAVPPGRYVRITVGDEGEGIARENLDRIFDPYFTTRPENTGLGLASSDSIVRRHEGSILVDSRVGVGSVFKVFLPVAGAEGGRDWKPVEGNGKILLLDDEEGVLRVCGKMLSHLGFEAVLARGSEEACRLYREESEAENSSGFVAVILDLTLPGGPGGLATLGLLREMDPGVRAIASSGYSRDPVVAGYEDHGFRAALIKPYDIKELSDALEEALDLPPMPTGAR